jgi:hypothetical protein
MPHLFIDLVLRRASLDHGHEFLRPFGKNSLDETSLSLPFRDQTSLRIDFQREPTARMPHKLLDNLDVLAACNQECRVRVTKCMPSNFLADSGFQRSRSNHFFKRRARPKGSSASTAGAGKYPVSRFNILPGLLFQEPQIRRNAFINGHGFT